jgi:DNA-binding CsgD family transcriptional regulator
VRSIPSAADLLKLLDAVYDVERPRSMWFTGVLDAFLGTFGRGAGVGGLLYNISPNDRIDADLMKGLQVSDDWRETGLAIHRDRRFIPDIVARYRATLCATLPELFVDSSKFKAMRADYYDRFGVRGQIMVNGVDCSGKGCVVYLFSPTSLTLSDVQRDLFCRLATHIATAYRLQRKIEGDGGTRARDDAEAILTPGGHVEHAEVAAQPVETRQCLTLAVKQRERTRHAANDTERIIRTLKGLVDARWTLVDHYDRGGKRYVLARENAPKPLGPARLSEREQQVAALAALGRTNKLIAYELGLAHPTVRVLMARACAKLGARTRTELIEKQRSAHSRGVGEDGRAPSDERGPPASGA